MILIVAHRRVCIFAAIFFFYFLLVISGSSYADEAPLKLQVYPYAPASKVLKQFTPLADYLKQTLNREVTIGISMDHNDHSETVGNDRADVAFLGPSSYVKLVEAYGKKPVIARIEVKGSPLLQGVIFTSSSSQLASLNDLKGKRFAFGYQNSTMSHLVPVYMLQQEGIHVNDLAQYAFLNDQYNVALGVLMGDFDAGAVNVSVFHKYKGRGLKELARSPQVSEHLFVARSSLSEDTVTVLKRAFLDVKKDKNAQMIMSSIRKDMTAFVPASDRDYDNLRKLLQSIDKSKTAP